MDAAAIRNAKANYWFPALVFIPENEANVAWYLFSTSAIMGAVLGLMFIPPVLFIVII
jgi:hypothetical protein